MAGLKFEITGDNSSLLRSFRESQEAASSMAKKIEDSGTSIDGVINRITTAAAGMVTAFSAQQLASKVMQIRGEFQQLEVAFTTMLGSAEDAKRLMEQLVKTAATTPFDLQSVSQGAKQLLAYGTSADEVNEILVRLGDIAAGLSIPLNDLVYLYGTTMTQGRMFTMDLRQFMGRGIPMAEELAKQFGVTKDKVGELVTAGKVGAEDMKKAIISMTSEGGKFGGLMEKQSHTITGQISNIEDAIDGMFNEIGKKNDGVINAGLGAVSKLVENWETVARVLGTVAAAYGISKAAIIAYNVYQTIHNRLLQEAALQSKLAAMNNITLSNSEAMAAARTTLFSASIKGLTAAIAANPVGALTVGLTALLSVIQLVNTDTDKMSINTEKYGKDAATTIATVDTCIDTLKGLSDSHDTLTASSGTSKKVLEELNGVLSDYGVTQIQEGDNIDVVNAKREQAIELIKQESIERQRLNNLDAINQEYQQALQDAQNELLNDLNGAVFNITGDTLLNRLFGSADEIREKSSAISMIMADVVKDNIGLVLNKTGDEYEKGLEQMYSKIRERMKDAGLSDATISKEWNTNSIILADNIVQKYINTVQEKTEAQRENIQMVEKSAEAERDASSASMDYGDKVAALERKLEGPTDGVHQLYKNIKELMSQYKDNTIGFHINFDGQFPSWMGKMEIPELKRLSKRFAAIGANLKDGGIAIVGGKRYTKQQSLQHSADYAEAYEYKQNQKDAADKEAKRKAEEAAKDAEKNKKKYASEAKRKAEEAKREQERIAEETRNRNKAIKGYEESVLEQQKETELALRQQNIDLKEDSYEKEIEQINLNYDRLIAENEKRRKDMIKALKDNKVNEWLNKNPKATKAQQEDYINSLNLTDVDLNNTQKTQLGEYDRIAIENRRKSLSDISNHQITALNDYLKEYGSFEEKKLAITQEYEEKIRKASSVGEKATLEMQRDKEIETAKNEGLQNAIDWNGVFSDLQGHTKQYLQGLRSQLQDLLNAGNLPIDQMQTVSEKINAIDDELGKQQGIWDFVGERTREHNRLLKEAADAQDRLNVAKSEEVGANANLGFVKMNVQKRLSDAGVEMNIGDISTANLNGKIDLTDEKFKGMVPLLQKLAVAEGKLTEAGKKTVDATNKSKQAKDGAKRNTAQEIADWFSDAQEFIAKKGIDQIPDLLGSVGLGSAGEKVQKGLDGFNSAAGAAADFASGNYIGAAFKGISAIKSFGSALGIGGGNEKQVAETTERLMKSNEHLAERIDDLSDIIGDSAGAKAVNAYDTALKAQEEINKNNMEILKAQMGYHSKHHSNAYYSDDKEIASYNKDAQLAFKAAGVTASTINGLDSIYNLTPEQLKAIKDFAPDLWRYITEVGKYDKSEYWDAVVEQAGKTQELTKQIQDNLTQTSFDSLRSGFLDTLMDMDSDAEDWSTNFSKMLFKSFVNHNVLGDEFDSWLETFREKWAKKIESGNMSKQDYADYRKEYDSKMQELKTQTNNLAASIGYSDTNSSQKATANGVTEITYEQANNIVALTTAGNITREQTRVLVDLMRGSVENVNQRLNELVSLSITRNSYLEDILKRQKVDFGFKSTLEAIEKNTRNIL